MRACEQVAAHTDPGSVSRAVENVCDVTARGSAGESTQQVTSAFICLLKDVCSLIRVLYLYL